MCYVSSKPQPTICLTYPNLLPELTDSVDFVRYIYYVESLHHILQYMGYQVVIQTPMHPQSLENLSQEIRQLKQHPAIYRSSMGRQPRFPFSKPRTDFYGAASALWIKAADYGDDRDQLLEDSEGEPTQLWEDIVYYHHQLTQNYDGIIVVRPELCPSYDRSLLAAMRSLGYSPQQFQVLTVQPIQLVAVDQQSQQICAITPISCTKLNQEIGAEHLRWQAFSVPSQIAAPLNLSTLKQASSTNSFYRVKAAYDYCCFLLHRSVLERQLSHQQVDMGTIDLDLLSENHLSLEHHYWQESQTNLLCDLVEITPEILQQSVLEAEPHIIVQHAEAISVAFQNWLQIISLTKETYELLFVLRNTLLLMLKLVLGVTPEAVKIAA